MKLLNNKQESRAVLRKKKTFFQKLCEYKFLLFMLLPAVVTIIIFNYIPMAGIVLAFKNYNFSDGIFGSPWVGFENFRFFFESGKAWIVTRNTFLYNVVCIFLGVIAKIVVSIAIAEMGRKYLKKTMQTFMLFPHFISWVTVGIFCYNIFSDNYGVLNSILVSMGMDKVQIYQMPGVWPFIIVMFRLWKTTGYGSIVYLATLAGIDSTYYEAAKIDGANAFKRIWYITIPCLRPSIVTLILLDLGHVFRGSVDVVYSLTGGNSMLYNATDVIDTYVFRTLMNTNDFGLSTAIGLFQSVICFIFILLANGCVKKLEPDSSLF